MRAMSEKNPPENIPLHPIALKIVGDGVLVATLLRAAEMPADAALEAVLLALAIAVGAGTVSGMMLVRAGHRALWDVTSLACMAAMAIVLAVHGSLIAAAVLGALSWFRWRQIARNAPKG